SVPTATNSAVAGTSDRRHSITALRPSTFSCVGSPLPAPDCRPDPRPPCCGLPDGFPALRALAAGWCGRISLAGVAPRPRRLRRPLPPEPDTWPFFEPLLRSWPRRDALRATDRAFRLGARRARAGDVHAYRPRSFRAPAHEGGHAVRIRHTASSAAAAPVRSEHSGPSGVSVIST